MLEEVVRSKLVILFISVIVLTCLAGCSAESDGDLSSGGSTVIWVTRDFGTEEIASFEADVGEGNNVMELLQKHLNGDGIRRRIVNARGVRIRLQARHQKNKGCRTGFLHQWYTPVGAPDYVPADKDVIQDYHPWGDFYPAVSALFPSLSLMDTGNNPAPYPGYRLF